jgi:hypothetical protein
MSLTKNFRLRCDICGRFIGFDSPRYSWTPYGGSQDLEPPEDEHSHKKCFEDNEEKWKNLIIKTSWVKPYLCNYEE